MQAPDIPCGAHTNSKAERRIKMLLGLGQGVYWLTTIFAVTLIVSAAALALDIGKADGFELYVVAGLMAAAAVGAWLFGRAVYRMAR
jgi:hypothetical protein